MMHSSKWPTAAGISLLQISERPKEDLYSRLIADGIIVPFSGTIEGERAESVLCNYVAPEGLSNIG